MGEKETPQQVQQWVKERYFTSINGKNWVFYGVIATKEGFVENYLLHPAHVAIKRHVKIKGEANPYDPAWEEYFEKRLGVKMAHNLKGKRQLSALWKEQNGLCPICQQQDHQAHRMAQPPSGVASERRERYRRQSGLASPPLPQTSP